MGTRKLALAREEELATVEASDLCPDCSCWVAMEAAARDDERDEQVIVEPLSEGSIRGVTARDNVSERADAGHGACLRRGQAEELAGR